MRSSRLGSPVVLWFLAGVHALTLLFLPVPPALAQTLGEGVRGWCNAGPGGVWICHGSPLAACAADHAEHNPAAEFYGYTEGVDWWSKQCAWCLRGHTPGVCYGTLPPPVYFLCESGYSRVPFGSCVKAADPREQVTQCVASGGHPSPRTDHPILVLTGAKVLTTIDFATADGLLRVERSYRSIRSVADPWAVPLGLDVGWLLGFQMELQISFYFSTNGYVSLQTPDANSYGFARQSDGSIAPRFTGVSNSVKHTGHRVSFADPWPSNLAQVRQMKTRWTVVDEASRTWHLETFTRPGTPTIYDVARPVRVVDRSGYEWVFAYGPIGDLQTITDSFGRLLTFSWLTRPYVQSGVVLQRPLAISGVQLPDGTRLRYVYDVAVPAGADPPPDRLIKVERLDMANAVLDTTTYHYEDVRFPWHLTGTTDARGVRTLTVAYDARGRAISSELAGGAERSTVEYPEVTTPITRRRVTNALGKSTVYRFQTSGSGSFRLVGVDGEASTNCPASARSYTYDANGWVLSKTDEEGRKTTYVRDARGQPTSITRGAP
jgi:YD repeat-containing protein